MEKLLTQLTEKLKDAFERRLVSVTLYGSAAAGEHNRSFSDLNVFCVVTELTSRELADSEPVFRWWREQGHPSPLLMSREEVLHSTDSFPIEFLDMRERRRVLYGEDIVAELQIDDRYHRAELEHELRSKLLRLRQKATAVLSDREMLVRLMADSASTFLVLIRHSLLAARKEAPRQRRALLAAAGEAFCFEPRALYTLVDLREEKKKAREIDAIPLLDQYMGEIQAVIAAVDRQEQEQ